MFITNYPKGYTVLLLMQLLVLSTHGSLMSQPLALFNDDPGNCETTAKVWTHNGEMEGTDMITHFIGGETLSASMVSGTTQKSCLATAVPFVWVGQDAGKSDIKFFNNLI
jgi:hypothetical protein